LRHQDGMVIIGDEQTLRPENYYIVTDGKLVVGIGTITTSNGPWLVRTISVSGVQGFVIVFVSVTESVLLQGRKQSTSNMVCGLVTKLHTYFHISVSL